MAVHIHFLNSSVWRQVVSLIVSLFSLSVTDLVFLLSKTPFYLLFNVVMSVNSSILYLRFRHTVRQYSCSAVPDRLPVHKFISEYAFIQCYTIERRFALADPGLFFSVALPVILVLLRSGRLLPAGGKKFRRP
jgi:hypothetical protein